jgi:hypothetical protein
LKDISDSNRRDGIKVSYNVSNDLLKLIRELAKPPQWQFSEIQLFNEFLREFNTDITSAYTGFSQLIQQ